MKILVIGAAGKTGKAVIAQALKSDHMVSAFVHKVDGYVADPNVRVFGGDAKDRSAMDSAMLGQDAVIDTVGNKNPLKATTLESRAAAAITASMQSKWSLPSRGHFHDRRMRQYSEYELVGTPVPVDTSAARDEGQGSYGSDSGYKWL